VESFATKRGGFRTVPRFLSFRTSAGTTARNSALDVDCWNHLSSCCGRPADLGIAWRVEPGSFL